MTTTGPARRPLASWAAAQRVPSSAEWLLAASFAWLALRVLYFVLINSAIEWPFEYREFAPVSFTGALLNGINPYALESEPFYSNVYGPVYSLVVWPLAALVGNSFQVHRLVALFFIGAASCLVYGLVRRGRGGRALASCAGAVFFLATVDDVSGLARADALGVFLFLSALAVLAHSRSASTLALASSALLVALAFFTKPYFALAAVVGAAFVLLRRGPGTMLRYGAWGTLWFALLGLAAYLLWPTLFINTVVLSANAGGYYEDSAHLLSQGSVFLRSNLGFLVALVTLPFAWFAARAGREADPVAGDVRAVGLSGLVAGVAALALVLGAHTGNGQLYYTQLILPFLLILVPPLARGSRIGRVLVFLAFAQALALRHDFSATKLGSEAWLTVLPQLAALSATSPYQYGSPVFDVGEENRRSRDRVHELITSEPGEVFVGPESSALLLEIRGKYYDNGLNQYCIYGTGGDGPLLREYRNRCSAYWTGIFERLRVGEFARVLLIADSRYRLAVRGQYRLTARFPIRLGYSRKEMLVFERVSR